MKIQTVANAPSSSPRKVVLLPAKRLPGREVAARAEPGWRCSRRARGAASASGTGNGGNEKANPRKSRTAGGTLRDSPPRLARRDWRVNDSAGHLSQSPSWGPRAPALCPSRPPIQNRNRVSAPCARGGRWGRLSGFCRSSGSRGAAERGNMSDAAGEGPRVRRYPELPVWVVEDHQEVSGRGGARAWEDRQNRNVVPARVALRWGEPQDLGRVGAGVSGALSRPRATH